MKWLLGILLILSLVANGVFIWLERQAIQFEEERKRMDKAFGGGPVEDISWEKGRKQFLDTLIKRHPTIGAKKYFYVSVWSIICRPCIKEMPLLDSLAGKIDKDVAYVFMGDNTEGAAMQCINRQKFKLKNFIFINDLGDFISYVYKKKKIRNKVYPIEILFDKEGKILYSEIGAYEPGDAKEFVDLFQKLK